MARPLLIFLHLAKTGGQSVETMLRSTFGPRYCRALEWQAPLEPGADDRPFLVATYGHDDFRRLERLNPWMQAAGGHAITLWSNVHELRPVRYFAFLRDPLARAASHYQYHAATSPSPLDWERWCAWDEPHNHQVRFFVRDGDANAAIAAIEQQQVFVGLIEHFDECLVMLKRLVAPELNLAYLRRNVAERNDLARQILADPVRREQLWQRNRGEQPLYDYVANELLPRYRRAYGPTLADDVARFQADRARGYNHLNDRLHRAVFRFYWNPAVTRHRRRRA
jgi:hypothetical protein